MFEIGDNPFSPLQNDRTGRSQMTEAELIHACDLQLSGQKQTGRRPCPLPLSLFVLVWIDSLHSNGNTTPPNEHYKYIPSIDHCQPYFDHF